MAENKLNLSQRLLAITSEIGKIEKTGRNSQQGYAFIEQAKIVAELRPQLAKHGVMIMPSVRDRFIDNVTNSKGTSFTRVRLAMEFQVINADDPTDCIVINWDAGEALDTSDKATNKAITAAQKTFLMKLFNISDQDDPDQHTIEATLQTVPPVTRPVAVSANSASPDKVQHARDLMSKLGKTGKNGLEFSEMTIGKKVPTTDEDFDKLIDGLEALDALVGGSDE